MAVVYWRGLTPKYNPNPGWQTRSIVCPYEFSSAILAGSLILSEQLRDFTFWIGRVSDLEESS